MTTSSEDRLIVLVGASICIIIVGYIIFRICGILFRSNGCAQILQNFRRWCSCSCCCCNHDVLHPGRTPFFTSMQRSCRRLESLLSKQPELIVENAASELRVGDTAHFEITLPENRNVCQRSSSQEAVPVAHPSQNALSMSEQISIEIKKLNGMPEKISFIQEFGQNPETNVDSIGVKYTVREAGIYEIHVLYQNSHVAQSPHLQTFRPTDIDPEKTNLIRQAPMVVTCTVTTHAMTIEPKDRFGNICRPDNFDVHDFHFRVTHMDQNFKDEPVETIAYEFSTETTDEWGVPKMNIRLSFEVFVPGYYRGIVLHQDRPIGNSIFELVCLTPEENGTFGEMLKTPSDSVFHKAKLLSTNSDVQKSPPDVFIYTSLRAIIVKQFFFLNLLPYRQGFYRILPATKIELLIVHLENQKCTFTIFDRNQPKLTLKIDSTSFRVFMALFAHNLQKRLGGSESFENKQKFFYDELRLAREHKTRDFINIFVNRNNLLESSMTATKSFGVREWCRKFKVQFEGEEGFDDGGLRRELLNMICEKLFQNDPTGPFCCFGTSRLVHPNPHRGKEWTMRHYEFAGKIVGKCLFESSFGGFFQQMVNGRFSRSFLAHLIGSFPQHKHFEQDDPELHLRKVKYILENDVTPMELVFQEEEYDASSGTLLKAFDLIPNGKGLQVTNENKDEYLAALAQFRLGTRMQSEIDAFLKGLHLIVPEGLLSNFDENELEILMCGKSTFDIEDLKRNHVVTESGMGEPLVRKLVSWFWTGVEGMSVEERGRLLQFTTGSSLLPTGGFKDLRPAFRITITNTTAHLPIAHTCFSEICLSNHNTFEEFNRSLRFAVNECSEGFSMM